MGQQRGGGARGGPVPAAPGAQGNRGGAGRGAAAPTNFPAQQRPAGDPAIVARGNTLYGIHCRSCHGADLRGGEQGGINLLRSQLVLNDQNGELIFPVVRDGLNNPGLSPMPAVPISLDEVKAIAEYIHSVAATAQRQGGPPPGPPLTLNILVGDAAAGKTYFACKMQHVPLRDRRPQRHRRAHRGSHATSEFLACRRWRPWRQRDSGNGDGHVFKTVRR